MTPSDKRRLRTRANIGSARRRGKSRRRKIPLERRPLQLEHQYERLMVGYIGEVADILADSMAESFSLVQSAERERRFDADEIDRLRELINRLKSRVSSRLTIRKLKLDVLRVGNAAEKFQNAQMSRVLEAATGVKFALPRVGVPSIIDRFVAENVSLIQTIPSRLFEDVEGVVTRGITAGITQRDLTNQIAGRFGVSRKRARVIARDQINKVYSQIAVQKQRQMGVTEFIWRTVGDARVRDEHMDLEGKRFSYSNPPSEGMPGQPIQCRCYPEPVLSGILG